MTLETLPFARTSLAWPRGILGGEAPRVLLPDEGAGVAQLQDVTEPLRGAARSTCHRLRGGGRLALVVPDRTRPLPLHTLLPEVIRAFVAVGVSPERVSVVAASGIHRPMDANELAAWVGEEVARSGVRLVSHDADAPAADVGSAELSDGSSLPVSINPAVAEAERVLVLGRIVFHYLAGYGGGRKMLVPGVAARSSILAMHARCLDPNPGAGRHARARAGRLAGNPVHEAARSMARLCPEAVGAHILLGRHGELLEVLVGDLFDDHERACESYGAIFGVAVAEPLDAVVVSAGGHPLDRDLVQAHKALDAVAGVVRDGGTIVLVAACGDGVGNEDVARGLRLGSPAEIDAELRRDFRVGVHTALALAEKTRRFRVLALTEIDDELAKLVGFQRIPDLEAGARMIREDSGPSARVALAPLGASCLYRLN